MMLQLSNFIYVKGDLTSIYISTVKQNHTLPLPPSSSARNEVEIYKAKLRQEFGYSTLVFGGLVDTESRMGLYVIKYLDVPGS